MSGIGLVLLVVACELILMVFLFCIARFYRLKFRESTYESAFLIPIIVLVALMAFSAVVGLDLEWALLASNVCSFLVLVSAGFFLYRKMMGVST